MVYYITGALICSTLLLYVVRCGAVGGSGGEHKGNLEVIIPRRVSRRGEFVTHFLSNTYKRSNLNGIKRNSNDDIHYIIPLHGTDHHVELRPNHQLISPGMIIENHGGKISERSARYANETQCHYTGFVRGDKDSKVAISTCHGLTGYVRTKRHYFFIEPLPGHTPDHISEHPHLVNFHSLQDNFDVNCETSGDIADVIAKRTSRYQRQGEANKCIAELHIETLVVIDHSMLSYHKEIDVENYVLTVFNMAHDLYHDASLGTNINLAIVRLIRLEQEDHEMNMAINNDAVKTLEYFREWQNTINPKEDSHPNHHDIAVLLTRIDICGSDNSCGLLGASKIGGMCDPHNQAAICEDNGLRLGYVIAHEIAHTLAILHDTPEDSGCNSTFSGNLTTVMDPSVTIRTAGWSPCSYKFLQIFVDSGFGKCMYDTPTEHSFAPVDILPGVIYDGNFQCKELFGPNSALCMTGIECDNLICYIEDKGCVETHTGVAPGTSCGEKMWCIRGECIELGEREYSVDGDWGQWSEWSECSRTCGSGVAVQERHCDSPRPKNGGKYCHGEHLRHRICATEPCDVNQPSFRDVQCAEFNSWVYPEDGTVHTWKNYPMPDENPCVLFCINDYGDIASLRPRVIDGTSCQRGLRDICVNGLCQEIPCDLDLESNAIEDACGVCKGDSTSCDLKMGEIQVPCCGRIKEEHMMEIPALSLNIKIEEMVPSESRIQIRNCDGDVVFIFGNVFGTFNVPGSIAWMGNIRAKQEAVRIPGPISEPISIWLVVVENVTIRYSYGVPSIKKRKPMFYWDFLRWKRCSAECGPGIQESFPSCVEKMGGEVDDRYCKSLRKPNVQIKACEAAPCVTRWFVGDWQPCSKCPKGKRIRVVKCTRPTGQGEGEVVFISDSQCVGPKPKHREACTCPVTKAPSAKKRDVYVDSDGRVEAKAPDDAKQRTVEDIQVDSEGNVLKAKAELLKNPKEKEDISSLLESTDETTEPIPTTTSPVLNTTSYINHTLAMDFNETTPKFNATNPEHCKNASLAQQYKEIKFNVSAPHCPTDVEYDEDLYCNETMNYDNGEMYNGTMSEENGGGDGGNGNGGGGGIGPGGQHYVNLTTCIIIKVNEMQNATEPSVMDEEFSTQPMNLYDNATFMNDSNSTTAMSVLRANSSDEICSKLAKLIGKTALDKEKYDNLTLTIHTELENGQRPAGLPPPANKGESDVETFSLHGKKAMEFMNAMQKDFDNNKTKI
ncbi:hypothetical protein Trydic_g19191 [Trypoxylus dichotomus]